MATRRRATSPDESRDTPAPDVVTTPPPSFGHDHSFTLQAIFDLKASVTELTATIKQLQQTTESTKTKVGELHDLKHKFVGGAAVLAVLLTFASGLVIWVANKSWDLVADVARPAIKRSFQGDPVPSVPSVTPPTTPSAGGPSTGTKNP